MRPRACPARRAAPRNRGVVLVLVLWVITLLTVIASGFGFAARTEARLSRNVVDATQARYLARAGVTRALLAALHSDPESRWPADGTVQRFTMAGATVDVTLRDETGLVDLNRAWPVLLQGLFREAGADEATQVSLTDAVLDWRDADDLRQPSGAEDADYWRAGRHYGAKDGAFSTVEELQLVLGMTPDLFRRLEPWLTVHTASGVNRAAAPAPVLRALGGATAPSATAGAAVNAGIGQRDTNIYRIVSTARLASGATASVRAVVRIWNRTQGRFSVLEWKAGAHG